MTASCWCCHKSKIKCNQLKTLYKNLVRDVVTQRNIWLSTLLALAIMSLYVKSQKILKGVAQHMLLKDCQWPTRFWHGTRSCLDLSVAYVVGLYACITAWWVSDLHSSSHSYVLSVLHVVINRRLSVSPEVPLYKLIFMGTKLSHSEFNLVV